MLAQTCSITGTIVDARDLNVYARENVHASRPGVYGINHQVFGIFDSMFPLIPSAWLSLEF